MRPWMEQKFGLDLSLTSFSQASQQLHMHCGLQWNLSNQDTLATEESVLVSGVS